MQPNIHTLVKPTKRYKICVARTLVDRTFKFNNTSAGFHLVINGLTKTLRWNLFPSTVIENVVGKFPNNNFAARKDTVSILNYRTLVLFPSQDNAEFRN